MVKYTPPICCCCKYYLPCLSESFSNWNVWLPWRGSFSFETYGPLLSAPEHNICFGMVLINAIQKVQAQRKRRDDIYYYTSCVVFYMFLCALELPTSITQCPCNNRGTTTNNHLRTNIWNLLQTLYLSGWNMDTFFPGLPSTYCRWQANWFWSQKKISLDVYN